MVPDNGAPIQIALMDDQKLVREALGALIDASGSARVVCSMQHAEPLEQISAKHAEVLLIGFDAQLHDPIATVQRAVRSLPALPLCALVTGQRSALVQEAMAAGCGGVVSSEASVDVLLAAIRSLANGEAYVDPKLAGELLSAQLGGKQHGALGRTRFPKKDDGGDGGNAAAGE